METRTADGTAPEGEVWHFSEDPTITRFVPHVARTATQAEAYVWACGPARCADYWFPRQAPRGLAWRTPGSDPALADALLGPGVDRLHVIEHACVPQMSTARLFAYRFAASGFREIGGYAHVSDQEQTPLGPPVALASPWELHAFARQPVLVVDDLFPWWERVIGSGLGFSGIRLRNSPHHAAWAARRG